MKQVFFRHMSVYYSLFGSFCESPYQKTYVLYKKAITISLFESLWSKHINILISRLRDNLKNKKYL